MGSDGPVGAAFLEDAWAALGAGQPPDGALHVSGRTGLDTRLQVPELAVGAVAAQLMAARTLRGVGGRLDVDATHVGFAFRSERYVRLADGSVAGGFAPLSRFFRTSDGWIRLHGNYPHHRAAAEQVLGPGDPVAAAAGWSADDLETAIVEAGGAAAAVRTPEEWARHPQGAAVAELPLLDLRRVADGRPRDVALDGLRVLDLTRVIAGPVGGRTLASHGADVLRLDSPQLPDDPVGILETGGGKRHVVVDLASRAGRATLEELLAAADVVLQGYRPGALDTFGLDPASLADRHPHLAVVRLRAWGPAGPWQDRRGFDSLVQAASGIAALLGTDGVPGVLPAQALDHATGHLAAAAAMMAVAHRRRSAGIWQAELSLAQVAAWLMAAGPVDQGAKPHARATDADVSRYLVTLPAIGGPVTVVAPPGSPVWKTGVAFAGEHPEWLPRARRPQIARRDAAG